MILPWELSAVYNQPVAQVQTAGEAEDERFMRQALHLAELAAQAGEVPIGALIVAEGLVVGRGNNRTRRERIVAAHAELVALRRAQRRAGDFRLAGAVVYVTVEPCLMCLGALLQARLGRIVYGAAEPKFGALESRLQLRGHPLLRKVQVRGGVLSREAGQQLRLFFAALRQER